MAGSVTGFQATWVTHGKYKILKQHPEPMYVGRAASEW